MLYDYATSNIFIVQEAKRKVVLHGVEENTDKCNSNYKSRCALKRYNKKMKEKIPESSENSLGE